MIHRAWTRAPTWAITGPPFCLLAHPSTPHHAPVSAQQAPRAATTVVRASGATATSSSTASEDLKLRERLATSIGVAVVTDDAVPEGHKGLHGFLYGEGGGSAAHEGSARYDYRQGEDDGTVAAPVSDWLAARDGEKPMGVYALSNVAGVVQYVAYSRNAVLAVKAHLARVGPERCASVRCMVFANKAMATRSNLEQQAQNWIDACPAPPPGNGGGAEEAMWDGRVFDASLMSELEVVEYEDKKLKMRKAMGENLHDDVADETLDAKTRRLKLLQAVEGDDWSSVIDGQTEGTKDPAMREAARLTAKAAAEAAIAAAPRGPRTRDSSRRPGAAAATAAASSAAAPAAAPQIVSPFMRANVQRSAIDAAVVVPVAMTVESVDRALDSVRPYLIADGGNVEVAAVENGDVFLRLQGACGTCPSSTATMKMGIERKLRETFGDTLRDVVQLGAVDMRASAATVDAHLDVLRPAIKNFGGSIEVLSVADGVARMRFTGPPAIAMGITAAVKDKFPDVKEVVLVDN